MPDSPPSSRDTLRPYWCILLLAAALRIAWAALVPIVPISDCHSYDVCAQNLAEFNTFGYEPDKPWAFWPVGTSFAYSLVYRVFDPIKFGYTPVAIFNVLLGTGTVALAMAAAHRWFGRIPAMLTGLILAIWPTHVFFTTIIASETLFTALCLAAILAWPERLSLPRLLLAGVLLAVATYVRPTAMLLPVMLAAASWLSAPRLRSLPTAGASVAVALVAMAILIAPWAARNRHVFGRAVLISTNGGTNLWMGNNPTTTGEYQRPPEFPGKNEAERDALLKAEARRFIMDQPIGFIKRTVYKGLRLHATETIGVGWNIEGLKKTGMVQDERSIAVGALKGVSTAYWLMMLALGLVGMIVLAQNAGVWAMLVHPAVAIWAYFALLHAVIVIQDRYHLPFTPMVASLAGVSLASLWERRRKPVPA